MAEYENGGNEKYKYTGIAIICAFIYLMFTYFFGYSERMECGQSHCDIYKVKNSNKVVHLYRGFDESDIIGYDVVKIGKKSETPTYIPIVILKDGSRIRLNALETSNYTEARHTTFISLKNRNFPR